MYKYVGKLNFLHQFAKSKKTQFLNKQKRNFCQFKECSLTIKAFNDKYNNFEESSEKAVEKLAGRILSLRKMSKDLTFADLNSNGDSLQLVFNLQHSKEIKDKLEKIKRGYIIGVEGSPFRTKTGQLSVLVKEVEILSVCKYDLPIMNRKDKEMLIDPETRYQKRYLDLIVNIPHKKYFTFRAKMIKFIRNYLDSNDFLEVETPILSHLAGGALAKPFVTHSNAIKSDLFLRVAPELFLKQLIIGGYERVYEIGKNFRNEDISIRHNPEFTSVEFYQSYSDYMQLMDFTKKFLREMVKELSNFDGEIKIKPNYFDEQNFQVFYVIPEFEKYFNTKININDQEEFYKQIEELYFVYSNSNNQKLPCGLNIKKKIEKLIEGIIEPKCMERPSFIINHPTILSPLAKSLPSNKLISERFELFVNGIEVINSYTELNDADEQKVRFQDQKNLRESNNKDEEIHPFDLDYLEALSHGMPPTAGWGMGVDRMCMLLLGLQNIKEIILFPLMNVKK